MLLNLLDLIAIPVKAQRRKQFMLRFLYQL